MEDPTSGTDSIMEMMRQRLTSLEKDQETAFLRCSSTERSRRKPQPQQQRPHPPQLVGFPSFLFRILTISFLICLFTMGIDHWSRSHEVTGELNPIQTPITNNKVFHHNRTTPGALAAVAKLKTQPQSKSKKEKRPEKSGGGQRPKPPHHPQSSNNVNLNNYFSTAMNLLSMGLAAAATTPKSIGFGPGRPRPPSGRDPLPPFTPFKATQIHPLTILKSQSNSSRETPPDGGAGVGPNNKGRSTLDFEPLFEAEGSDRNETNPSGGTKSGKNLEPGFFDKFEDHWDDPIAEESVPNSFTVVDPPFRPGPLIRPGAQKHGHMKPGSSYVDQKNVNYWPNNLNSYYGIRKPHTGRRPGEFPIRQGTGYDDHREVDNHFAGSNHHHHQHHQQQQHYDDDTYDDNEPGVGGSLESESVNYKKTTIMDRVSVFYSEYKILAWAIVVVAAAVVALGALLGLYLNNPPTEVVSARHDLTRAMNDPQLMTFLDSLSNTERRSSQLRDKKAGKSSRPKGQT